MGGYRAGALVNDMNTVGFTGILNDDIAVFVNPSRVTLGSGVSFGCVMVRSWLLLSTAAMQQAARST